MAERRIYLDHNATTPPHPDVVAAMAAAAEDAWANPASVHGPGRRAREHVERARDAVARLLALDARDVVLTSGGTEANNLALELVLADGPGALVVSRLEHPSIVRPAEALAARGGVVEWFDVRPSGVASVEDVMAAMERAAQRAPVRVVSLQAVNHETGMIQPIGDVASAIAGRGALLHVDAVQAVGRVGPAAWRGADLVTFTAHKVRGPKGVGAIASRAGVRIRPILRGGAQERGLRPGTQDGVACAGLAVAADRARETPTVYGRLAALRDRLEAGLAGVAEANGAGARAPHVASLAFRRGRSDEIAAALDLEGVACSSGSACSAGTSEPSPVVLAMLGEGRAARTVRFSLGETTTDADIAEALARIRRVLARFAGGLDGR